MSTRMPAAAITPRCTRCGTEVNDHSDLTLYDNDLMCDRCLYVARLPFDCTQCAVEVMEGR